MLRWLWGVPAKPSSVPSHACTSSTRAVPVAPKSRSKRCCANCCASAAEQGQVLE